MAYILSNCIRKKKHIRIISLGTGVGPIQPIDTETFTRFDWTKLAVDVAVDFDTFMADNVVKNLLDKNKGKYDTYLRMQGTTTLDFMSIEKRDLDKLIELGDTLWSNQRNDAERIIR